MSKLSNRVRATSLACTFALAGAVGGGQLATNASAATAKYTVKTFNFNPLNGHGNTQARNINEKGDIIGTTFEPGASQLEGFLLKSGSSMPGNRDQPQHADPLELGHQTRQRARHQRGGRHRRLRHTGRIHDRLRARPGELAQTRARAPGEGHALRADGCAQGVSPRLARRSRRAFRVPLMCCATTVAGTVHGEHRWDFVFAALYDRMMRRSEER
jgi:hypothetical protein